MDKLYPCPNVFLIGAAKAGTTSIYHYLLSHPDVFLPRAYKELNYFSQASQNLTNWNEYVTLFKGTESFKVRMDISTTYLYVPETAQKIKDTLGDNVKIILFLRNPVTAAYSLWKQMRHFGSEPLSFEEALLAEDKRRKDPTALPGWYPNFLYKERFCYSPQLQRYFDLFPSQNIKVFIYEEFFSDLHKGWKELCAFLEISNAHRPSNLGKVYNFSGSGRRSQLLHSSIYENKKWKKLFTWLMTEKFKTRLRLFLDDLNKQPSVEDNIPFHLQKELEGHFLADITETEKLIGRPLKQLWFST